MWNLISVDELMKRLGEKKWRVTGGRAFGLRNRNPHHHGFAVIGTVLEGGNLVIKTDDGRTVSVSTDNAHDFYSEIEIRQTFVAKEQRKKIDGGGWCEKPYVGIAVVLTDEEAAASIERECAEKAREEAAQKAQRERETKARDEAKRQRKAAEREERRQAFIIAFRQKFAGKTIVDIDLENHELGIKFSDGSTLAVESRDYEEYCSWLIVDGIEFDDFTPEGRR